MAYQQTQGTTGTDQRVRCIDCAHYLMQSRGYKGACRVGGESADVKLIVCDAYEQAKKYRG